MLGHSRVFSLAYMALSRLAPQLCVVVHHSLAVNWVDVSRDQLGSDFILVGSPGVDTWGVAMSDVMELCPPHGPRRPLDVKDYMFLSGVAASRLGWRPVELICPMGWTYRIDQPVMVDLKF